MDNIFINQTRLLMREMRCTVVCLYALVNIAKEKDIYHFGHQIQ